MAQQQNSASEGTLNDSQPKSQIPRHIQMQVARKIDVFIECKYEDVEIPSSEFAYAAFVAFEDVIDERMGSLPINDKYIITLRENVKKTGDYRDSVLMPIGIETQEYLTDLKVHGWKEVKKEDEEQPTKEENNSNNQQEPLLEEEIRLPGDDTIYGYHPEWDPEYRG